MALAFRAPSVTSLLLPPRDTRAPRGDGAPPQPACSPARPRCPRGRPSSRGYTLLEILTVISIIGILAALARPVVTDQIRDRAVANSALRVADVFRFARGRALQSQAVLVTFTATGGPSGSPGLFIREAVVTNAGSFAPTCSGTNWANGAATNRLLASYPSISAAAGDAPWGYASATFYAPGDVAKTYAEVCYTSRGQTYIRYAAGDAFAALTGVARVDVTNTKTSFRRAIFVPPSTASRVAL